MKFAVNKKPAAKAATPVPTAGHDDDQHEITLIGDDLSALKEVSETEDGQPSVATENLSAAAPVADCCEQGQYPNRFPMCASRVIDAETGTARINIILGIPERTKWLANIIGLIDSASEKDVVDITIDACPMTNNVYGIRSLLSAVERCRATVITHAGALETLGDIALWLSGDVIKWSKHMTAFFVRQQGFGYSGDIRDFVGKAEDACASFKEFRDYIAARGLFTEMEMNNMFETRGMLSLFGRELEARMNGLKQVK